MTIAVVGSQVTFAVPDGGGRSLIFYFFKSLQLGGP